MGSLLSTILILLSLHLPLPAKTRAQGPNSPHSLDLAVRDYALRSFRNFSRTGVSHSVPLPANFSSIKVNMARFRCGSLRRYGGTVEAFRLGVGLDIHPCVERAVIFTTEVGSNWSNLYSNVYDLTGYQLISPVLALFAYRADKGGVNLTHPIELQMTAGEKPITIDFSNVTKIKKNLGLVPFCASFEGHGKVTFSNQVKPDVCAAKRQGHFGLVIASPEPAQFGKKVSRGKAETVIAIAAVLGAVLLGLLLVAMFVKVKKKNRLEEMERRAYEEEALQVTMVGHVRAPMAQSTRTPPSIEHRYIAPFRLPR